MKLFAFEIELIQAENCKINRSVINKDSCTWSFHSILSIAKLQLGYLTRRGKLTYSSIQPRLKLSNIRNTRLVRLGPLRHV